MLSTQTTMLLLSIGMTGTLARPHEEVGGKQIKRDTMTCGQIYGLGSLPCGIQGNFCFNPLVGQTCCSLDGGYCDQGKWCAPVPGYCCMDGEDLETCSRNAGFDLPSKSGSAAVTDTYSAQPAPVVTSAPVTPVPVTSYTPSSWGTPAPVQPVATPMVSPRPNGYFNFTNPTPNVASPPSSHPTLIHGTKINSTIIPFPNISSGMKESAGRLEGMLVGVLVVALGLCM